MRLFLILPLALLAACSGLVGYAPAVFPSLEYCDSIDYTRRGNQVELKAQCRAPVR
jgi:hypothetical protein